MNQQIVELPPIPEFVEDMLGKHVGIGDRIAYAVTAGRSGDLVVGEVVGFQWPKNLDNLYYDKPELKIAVVEEARSTGGQWGDLTKPKLIHASFRRFVKLEATA